MDNNDMITAISNSIQTESNLITLITAQIITSMQSMNTEQLQSICTILGIDYTQTN